MKRLVASTGILLPCIALPAAGGRAALGYFKESNSDVHIKEGPPPFRGSLEKLETRKVTRKVANFGEPNLARTRAQNDELFPG